MEIATPIIIAVLPILIPMIVAMLRKIVPKPFLPVVAILLGGVVDFVNYAVVSLGLPPGIGAILGAAGIGLRQVMKEIKKLKVAEPN